jgi:REP element-mobilizing transposase RayT
MRRFSRGGRPTLRCVARLPRNVALPDEGVFHVVTRGVAEVRIYGDDADRLAFLALLANVTNSFAWEVEAFCLMSTHYHLVVGARRGHLSDGLHRLNGLHAQAFNRRYARRGHLFGDRFWADSIETDERLEATVRYVLLNPVRAGLCADPRAFRWCGSRYGRNVY